MACSRASTRQVASAKDRTKLTNDLEVYLHRKWTLIALHFCGFPAWVLSTYVGHPLLLFFKTFQALGYSLSTSWYFPRSVNCASSIMDVHLAFVRHTFHSNTIDIPNISTFSFPLRSAALMPQNILRGY
ncbi:hypothetical protein ABKN59_006320 [Abortiporus biennis]